MLTKMPTKKTNAPWTIPTVPICWCTDKHGRVKMNSPWAVDSALKQWTEIASPKAPGNDAGEE
jgi:hypothetical protein